MEFVSVDPDGNEYAISIGSEIPPGRPFAVRTTSERNKCFPEGGAIGLNAQDFSDIMYTMYFFGDSLITTTMERGRQLGLKTTETSVIPS
jgi:hypothetical protein